MTVEMINFPITRELFKRVERVASSRNQDIDSMLEELLSWFESGEDSDEARMAKEEQAYKKLCPELQSQYLNQYVAIFEGDVVDKDPDELALLERIERDLPGEVVLLKLVTDKSEKPLVVRRPKLVLEP